jgi:hypothetical protein
MSYSRSGAANSPILCCNTKLCNLLTGAENGDWGLREGQKFAQTGRSASRGYVQLMTRSDEPLHIDELREFLRDLRNGIKKYSPNMPEFTKDQHNKPFLTENPAALLEILTR